MERGEGIKIKCIAKRTDSGFYVTNVSDRLENLQKFVGGFIEAVTLFEDVVIICNEEGRIRGMEYNCTICGIDFYGDILIVGTDGEDFADLDPEFIKDFAEFKKGYVEE